MCTVRSIGLLRNDIIKWATSNLTWIETRNLVIQRSNSIARGLIDIGNYLLNLVDVSQHEIITNSALIRLLSLNIILVLEEHVKGRLEYKTILDYCYNHKLNYKSAIYSRNVTSGNNLRGLANRKQLVE